MRTPALVLVLSAALWATPASASDLPFGARHLPQLVDSSKFVVIVKDARPLPGGSTDAALFEVTADTAFKGSLPSKKVTVLVPLTERALTAERFANAAAFLRGPLSERELKEWGVSASGEVYQLAAAGNGLVAMNPARRDALEDYIAAADAPASTNRKQKWAERQLGKPDEFLQMSAVFEIQRQKNKERALKSLSSVVRSGASTFNARKLAVQVIGDSPEANATAVLRDAAENRKIPDPIRRDAVAAVIERPDTDAILEKWRVSTDTLLSTEARKLSVKKDQ